MFGNNKILGIEIGRDEIKAVELRSNGKDPFSISSYGIAEYDHTVLSEGNVIDSDAFADGFCKMYKENHFSAKHAVFGIDNQTTILRFASFPKVPDNMQRNLIRLNAQEHIPVPLNELELDYVPLSTASDDDGDKLNVLLCAVRKKTIQRILGMSKAAGITVDIIMPSQIAYANTILKHADTGNFMAVRIGKKSVYHIVFHDGNIAFIRSINFDSGAIAIMTTVSRSEKLIPDETEQINKEIAKGINASVDYCRIRTKQEIEKIIMTGSTMLRQCSTHSFEKDLQAPAEYLRLYEPDGRRGSSPPEEYDSCISLALSKFKNDRS